MKRLFWTVGCLLATLPCGAVVQTSAHPKFEVASIKPSAPDENYSWYEFPPGGRFNVVNKTLKGMIEFAWGIQPFQIAGGPSWLDSLHFDVNAKSETIFKPDQIPQMFQALLTDRFQLAIHWGTEELPLYALVIARKDGKLGPGLTESKPGSCVAVDQTPPRGLDPASVRRCGTMTQNPRALGAIGIPIAKLIPMLEVTLGRKVVDKTGLKGDFDIRMEWTPDETQPFQLPPNAPPIRPADPTGPSLFTAIQQQLGLKLESSRGPVDVLIIDRAEKPTGN